MNDSETSNQTRPADDPPIENQASDNSQSNIPTENSVDPRHPLVNQCRFAMERWIKNKDNISLHYATELFQFGTEAYCLRFQFQKRYI
jgi:hypothetical protein